jgi:hypothetical protein
MRIARTTLTVADRTLSGKKKKKKKFFKGKNNRKAIWSGNQGVARAENRPKSMKILGNFTTLASANVTNHKSPQLR